MMRKTARTGATAERHGLAMGSDGNALFSLLLIVGLFGLMYLLVIRPSSKRRREFQNLQDSLEVGNKVVTIGGLHGEITEVGDKTLTLTVADNLALTFERGSIAQVIPVETEETNSVDSSATSDSADSPAGISTSQKD